MAKTTCHNIYKHALKNAKKKREAEDSETTPCWPILPILDKSAEGDTNQAAEHNTPLAAEHNTPLAAETSEEVVGQGQGQGAERAAEGGFQLGSGAGASAENYSLLDLIAEDVLDSNARSGRPSSLTVEEKKQLVRVVKRSFLTRRMRLVDLRREAGLSHASDTTVFRALHEQGFKAYHEEFKFILTAENKAERMVSTYDTPCLAFSQKTCTT